MPGNKTPKYELNMRQGLFNSTRTVSGWFSQAESWRQIDRKWMFIVFKDEKRGLCAGMHGYTRGSHDRNSPIAPHNMHKNTMQQQRPVHLKLLVTPADLPKIDFTAFVFYLTFIFLQCR